MERYNKCTAAGGDYFEGDKSFMCVLSIKVAIRKKSGHLFNDPRICLLAIQEYDVLFLSDPGSIYFASHKLSQLDERDTMGTFVKS